MGRRDETDRSGSAVHGPWARTDPLGQAVDSVGRHLAKPCEESPANSGAARVAPENRPERVVSSAVMTERQSSEVEKVLLHIGDARSRARRAAEACAQDGADAHIVAALTDAELQLAELHRKLSQGTYYAVPDKSLKLAV